METAAARVRVKGTAFRGNLEMPRSRMREDIRSTPELSAEHSPE